MAHLSFDAAVLEGLKFSAALPLEPAERTLTERGSGSIHAAAVSRAALIIR